MFKTLALLMVASTLALPAVAADTQSTPTQTSPVKQPHNKNQGTKSSVIRPFGTGVTTPIDKTTKPVVKNPCKGPNPPHDCARPRPPH